MYSYFAAEAAIPSLQDACRVCVRKILREAIHKEHPTLERTRQRKPRRKRNRQKKINIVPMSMGMMILGQFDGSDDEERRAVIHTEDVDAEDESDGMSDREEEEEEESEGPESSMEAKSGKSASSTAARSVTSKSMPMLTVHQKKPVKEVEREEFCDCKGEETVSSARSSRKNGHQVEKERLGRRSRAVPSDSGKDTSSDDSDDDFDMHIVEMLRSSAMGMRESPPRKVRCSSSTSADTSETSGVCTVSDHSDESVGKPSPEVGSPPMLLGSSNPSKPPLFSQDNQHSVKSYMKEKISFLPIPAALKAYLMYYRN